MTRRGLGQAVLATALAAAAGLPARALAYDVVVVQSFQNEVYNKVIEGYQGTCGGQVTTFTLNKQKALDEDDLAEIKAKRPAAILAIGPSALSEILSRKPPMPVLFTAITEKPSNASPAGGVLMTIPMDRQLETLKKIAPQVKSIGVIYNPAKTQYFADDLIHAARQKGMTVNAVVATSAPDAVKDLSPLFQTVDAFVLAPDLTVYSETLEKAAGMLSLKLKKPVVGFKGSQLANGILFATEMDPLEMGKQAGDLTHELLVGKRPSEPFAPVKKYRLILNPKIAEQLGLRIPPEVASGAKIYGVNDE